VTRHSNDLCIRSQQPLDPVHRIRSLIHPLSITESIHIFPFAS
jgi:hypothetical protein